MPLESFLDEEFVWSHINESPANVEKLHLLCHSAKELKKGGYVMEQLSPVQIQAKTRCLKCGSTIFSPNLPLDTQSWHILTLCLRWQSE